MTSLLLLKALAALSIFLAAIVGGWLPMMVSSHKRARALIFFGETFARGIFLGAGLIHLLPEDRVFTYRCSQHKPVCSVLLLQGLPDGQEVGDC